MTPAGILSIELPLPFELETVNVYLVPLADGYLMIDCGMGTESSYEALLAGMQSAGVQWTDVRILLITHMHPDHMGLTERIVAASGAALWVHREERRLPGMRHALTVAGVPADLQARMEASFADIRKSVYQLHPDRVLEGGEMIATAIGDLEVIWTPGHTPGHICLYCAHRRCLFSGDQMIEHITPNISWQPDSDALGDYLESLQRLGELDIETVLPSHGGPFTRHREWVRKTTEHHRERCARILALIDETGKTAHGVVLEMWTRKLSPLHHHFAALEILAHLEYMRRRGEVRGQKEGGAMTWLAGTT